MHADLVGVSLAVIAAMMLGLSMLGVTMPKSGVPIRPIMGTVANFRLYDSRFGSNTYAIVDLPDGRTVTIYLPIRQHCTVGSSIGVLERTVSWGRLYSVDYNRGCAA